jgi:hypothetical protein
MCERFNHWILKARFLPIISMLEGIRRQVMVRIHENRTKAERWISPICPNTYKKLMTYLDHRFTVNLEDRTCLCRLWQLSGLPCPHTICSIYYAGRCLEDFVAKCYFIEEYNKTYAHCLQPVEGMAFWPVSDRAKPLPPKYVRMPERPKTERKRQDGEKKKPTQGRLSKKGVVIRCNVCKETGHNKTTCSRRTGSGDQSGGASQPTRASGGASQPSRGSDGASQVTATKCCCFSFT